MQPLFHPYQIRMDDLTGFKNIEITLQHPYKS